MSKEPLTTQLSPEGFLTSFTSGGGCHLLGKGGNQAGNQAGNQREKVATRDKILKIQGKMTTGDNMADLEEQKGGNHQNDIWLTRKEVEILLGVSHQAVKKACKSGRFKTIMVSGNGGRQYRIALSSLPTDAQKRYLKAKGGNLHKKVATCQKIEIQENQRVIDDGVGGGYNLCPKGYNQAYNQIEGVITSKAAKGYNQENEIWLTRKEVEVLLGISQPAIVKAIKKGHFKVIETSGNGGRQYRIALSSLPAEAQVKYLRENPSLWQEAMKVKGLAEEAINFLIQKSLPQQDESRDIGVTDMDKAWAVKEYLKYGSYRAARAIAEKLNINVTTLYRWVKKAENEAEKIRALKIESETIPVRFPRTQVPEDILLESLSIILSSQGKRIKNGWQYLTQRGIDISYSQYTRILNKMIPPFEKILSYHRSGRISALLNETPKIIRAWSEVPVMSVVVGDQHYLDYYFYSPELEDAVKVQLYLWADCSSRYFISCVPVIGQQYTQWHVQASLAEVFRIHVPDEIYTDWGKQENSKATAEFIERLSVGRIFLGDWDDFIERFPEARIRRRHSTAGVPPVKPIESMIRRFTEYLNQEGLTGYSKRDTDPFRNKELQEDLKIAIRQGKLPTLEEGLEVIRKVIEKCNTSEINTKEGRRFIPSQFFWQGLRGRRVVIPDDELAMIFFPAFIRKVRNASVQVKLGSKTVVFTARELTWMRDGEEVMVKVNPFPPHEGSMFFRRKGDDWEFLCPAQAWIGFGVNPQDQERLQRAMEVKNHYLKQFVLAIRQIHEKARPKDISNVAARRFTDAIRHKQEGLGELVYLDKRNDQRDKNWIALGKLAELYGY